MKTYLTADFRSYETIIKSIKPEGEDLFIIGIGPSDDNEVQRHVFLEAGPADLHQHVRWQDNKQTADILLATLEEGTFADQDGYTWLPWLVNKAEEAGFEAPDFWKTLNQST